MPSLWCFAVFGFVISHKRIAIQTLPASHCRQQQSMAALAQARALTGARAFRITSSSSRVVKVANGTKWTMKRKDSFMVEVSSVLGPGAMPKKRYHCTIINGRALWHWWDLLHGEDAWWLTGALRL